MNCFLCNRKVSVVDLFCVLNPHKFKCSECKELLSLNMTGLIAFYSVLAVSLILIGLYVYLINSAVGSSLSRGLIFWVSFSVATAIYIFSIYHWGKVMKRK